MRNKLQIFSKVFFISILSLFLSKILISNVFISETPKIRDDLLTVFRNNALRSIDIAKENFWHILTPVKLLTKTKNNLSDDKSSNSNELKNEVIFRKLSKGIYAEVKNGIVIKKIYKEAEVEWVEYSFNLNGKTIKVKVAPGENSPSDEFIKRVFSK